MRAKDFITELDPGFVNREIKKQNDPTKPKSQAVWKHKGTGATASVWEHFSDPNTVVKVVGGGDFEAKHTERDITLAFVHFCVDHGYQSKHFPIIHGMNIDDEEVLQIKIEKLIECSNEGLLRACAQMASNIRYNNTKNFNAYRNNLIKALKTNARIAQNNKADDIIAAIQLLNRAIPVYAKAHNIDAMWLDLHMGNWLLRSDGVIIAADPWYGESDSYDDGSWHNSYGDSDNDSGSRSF